MAGNIENGLTEAFNNSIKDLSLNRVSVKGTENPQRRKLSLKNNFVKKYLTKERVGENNLTIPTLTFSKLSN